MSTIVVVKKDGFAAIAADTLSKNGETKESAAYVVNNEKIIVVQENYLAIAGPTSGKRVLRHYFNNFKGTVSLNSADAIFAQWLHLHQALRETYFVNPNDDEDASFESSQMDILIANKHGIFGVAAYRSVQEFTRYYACGMGDQYALGAIYARYDDPSLSAEALARLGVEASAEFDDSTGLPVTSYSIKLHADGS